MDRLLFLDERVISLRLDTLQSDLNRWMLPLLPAGTAPFETPPHANSGSTQAHQQPRLNPADLQRIAVVNPRWTAWQSRSTTTPAAMNHSPLILVVGMHRSGTSLLGSLLPQLGVPMPGELIAGDDHNPEGYYKP